VISNLLQLLASNAVPAHSRDIFLKLFKREADSFVSIASYQIQKTTKEQVAKYFSGVTTESLLVLALGTDSEKMREIFNNELAGKPPLAPQFNPQEIAAICGRSNELQFVKLR